jgi:uncharacterized protein
LKKGQQITLTFFIFTDKPFTVKYLKIIILVLSAAHAFSQSSYTVETIPNTKLVNNSYVSNPDNILSELAVAEIDSTLGSLERNATAQVAVVVVNSIGDQDIFDFAQALFERWGLGQKQNDNGLLVLLVKEKHTVRFHTGNGIEGLLPDARCKRIQQEKMVPSFKEGDYDRGMVEGVAAIAQVLNDPESFATSEGDDVNLSSRVEQHIPLYNITFWVILVWSIVVLICFLVKKSSKSFAETANQNSAIPKAEFTSGKWFLWFFVVPVSLMILLTLADNIGYFMAGVYAYMGSTGLFRKNLMERNSARLILEKNYQLVYNYYQEKQTLFSFLRFVFPIPFAFMYGNYKKKMQFFRDHPRDCKSCGHILKKLDEQADDQYLSKGQAREEQLQSIDYDVWLCSSCNTNETLIYKNPESKYVTCSKCNFKTMAVVSRRTIRAASEYSAGEGEERRLCKFCGHQETSKYSIPKITRSSSSGSGSSSSGGGSWGGGSSGGGGASSSW